MIRWSPAIPTRPSCPHRRLERLLALQLDRDAVMGTSTLRPWASASFVGARHIFPCSGGNLAIEALQARLAAAEWRLPGHIVADVAVESGDDGGYSVEILTVED